MHPLFLVVDTNTQHQHSKADGIAVISLQALQMSNCNMAASVFPSCFPGHGGISTAAPWMSHKLKRD